jgi:phage portal protein BeeE
MTNPVGFQAVKMISEAVSALPLVVQGRLKRYDTHPVQDLLAWPNGAQSTAELLEAIYGQLLLNGNTYLEGVGEDGLPVEIHVLPDRPANHGQKPRHGRRAR